MLAALRDTLFVALAAGPAIVSGWWALLALVALPAPRSAPPASRGWRLTVIIPAHDEESTIPATLRSVAAAFPPADCVVVVADNCTDRTAEVARAHGATVLERHDRENRGKSFALDFAIATLRMEQAPPDAVIFLDADTVVEPDFFARMTDELEAGADVVQGYYQALPGRSDLSRLRRLAFALVHWARPLGASRFGLGGTLKGNGMAFRWPVIAEGTGGAGVTEDAAMTLGLVERGVAVSFAPSARLAGLMADNYRDAVTQDQRWEGGRAGLLGPSLRAASHALRAGNLRCAGAALEVAAPPLSLTGGLALIAAVGAWFTRSAALPLALFGVAATGAYVGIGLAAARTSWRDLWALREVPRFVVHKFAVYARLTGGAPQGWQRTQREESR